MARGDGKARKGLTKGTNLGVKRMATGGFAASSREGGFAAAGPSRLESPGQRSSVSPGRGNISAGNVPGGAGGNRDRLGAGSQPSQTTSRAGYDAIIDNPQSANVRLGPNAARSMVDAGVDADMANLMARSLNRRASDSFYSPGRADTGPARTGSFGAQTQRVEATPPPRQFPTRPISYTGVPKMEGTQIETGWDPVSGTFKDPKQATATPAKSPMAVYGNEFSFTPKELTGALKSMYWAGLPGASAEELKALRDKMKDPQNKEIARAIAAPFSDKTRAPVKSITERVTQDPNYSTKDQESVLGTSRPAIAKGDATKTTDISKTPATRGVTKATANVPIPKPRPEVKTAAAASPKPAAATPSKPSTPKSDAKKDGSVFVKDGVRYQIRDGKAYNFNVPSDGKGRRFGNRERDGRRGESSRNKKNGGRINGAAIRGWTKGKML